MISDLLSSILLVISQWKVTLVISTNAEAISGKSTLEYTRITMVNQAKQFNRHVGSVRTDAACFQPLFITLSFRKYRQQFVNDFFSPEWIVPCPKQQAA